MKKQKGQSLVEFALVVPLFLLLIFGLIYSGMLFHDYTSLSNIARSAAREAAITTGNDYTNIVNFYSQQSRNTLTTLYSQGENGFTVSKGDNDNEVYVKIHMVCTPNTSPVMRMVLPPTFDIVYFMKKDTPASSSDG